MTVRFRCRNDECDRAGQFLPDADVLPLRHFTGLYHFPFEQSPDLPCGPVDTIEGPCRIRLRRRKGWRKPETCRSVARPTKWGNPFKVWEEVRPDEDLWPYLVTPPERAVGFDPLKGLSSVKIMSVDRAVECHRWWILEQPHLMLSLDELAGLDLGCYCELGAPCHADTLLTLANSG